MSRYVILLLLLALLISPGALRARKFRFPKGMKGRTKVTEKVGQTRGYNVQAFARQSVSSWKVTRTKDGRGWRSSLNVDFAKKRKGIATKALRVHCIYATPQEAYAGAKFLLRGLKDAKIIRSIGGVVTAVNWVRVGGQLQAQIDFKLTRISGSVLLGWRK